MTDIIKSTKLRCAASAGILVGGLLAEPLAAAGVEPLLQCASGAAFREAFAFDDGGWRVTDDAIEVDAPPPRYAPGAFVDDPWTYYVVKPMNQWRYALAGADEWQDVTVAVTFRIQRPAPITGYRAGDSFFNYQWGRESAGCDLGLLFRYQGPDDHYKLRVSSGFGHLELWKTRGGIVRVKPHPFETDRDYRLAVTVSDAEITVRIDDQVVLEYRDPISPIRSGKIGLAARESHVLFHDLSVVPATPPATPVADIVAHRPDFHLKRWVGRDTIFDGDEPIAYVAQWPYPRLAEVKLVRGYSPLLLIEMFPEAGGPGWKLDNVAFGEPGQSEFELTASLTKENGEAAAETRFSVRYDPARGYVWEKDVRMTALVGGKVRKDRIEVTDPYFYQLPAPGTDKLPLCSDGLVWGLWSVGENEYRRFPVNHDLKMDRTRIDDRLISPGGVWVTTLTRDLAPVVEILPENTERYYGEYCFWGHDLHIRVHAGKATLDEGETFHGRVRYYAWPAEKAAQVLAQAELLATPQDMDEQRLLHGEPVNRFETVVRRGDPRRGQVWEGDYAIAEAAGRAGGNAMRLNAGRSAICRLLGVSYFTGPYLADEHDIGIWVKGDNLRGTVTLVLAAGRERQTEKLPLDGVGDWQRIGFRSRIPAEKYMWTLAIEVEGEGQALIDAVEIVPVSPAATGDRP